MKKRNLAKDIVSAYKNMKEDTIIEAGDNFEIAYLELKDKMEALKVNHILHLLIIVILAIFVSPIISALWFILWVLLVLINSRKISLLESELKKLRENKTKSNKILRDRSIS